MKLILDTNLWSPIGDEGVAGKFEALMDDLGITVVMPPSYLNEVLSLPKREPRDRIIRAMAAGRRIRLCTEAASESGELVEQVRRHRPSWLRHMPDTAKVHSLNNFWTKRVWRRALDDSGPMHEYLQRRRPLAEHMVAVQRLDRAGLLENQFPIRPLTAITASLPPSPPTHPFASWAGRHFEAWRVTSALYYRHQLQVVAGSAAVTREDQTPADWVGAYVDLARMFADPSDFLKFWLVDVVLQEMPRNWLRWAMTLTQADYKISSGNPADAQHAAYLLDCDLFLSADMRYVAMLDAIKEDAPFAIAEIRRVDGDRAVPILNRIKAVL